MKSVFIFLLLVNLLLIAGCLVAPNARPAIDLSVEAATQYIHRGMVQNERDVLQPALRVELPAVTGGALAFRTWGNVDLHDSTGNAWFPDGHGGKFSEVDLSAAYEGSAAQLEWSAGVVQYVLPEGLLFPNGIRGTTTEFFALASHPVWPDAPWAMDPFLELHIDWDEADGYYVNGGIMKTVELHPRVNADFEAALGYSEENHSLWTYGLEESGFSDLRGKATLFYTVDDRTSLSVGFGASTILDSTLQDWFDILNIDKDNFWLNCGVQWRF